MNFKSMTLADLLEHRHTLAEERKSLESSSETDQRRSDLEGMVVAIDALVQERKRALEANPSPSPQQRSTIVRAMRDMIGGVLSDDIKAMSAVADDEFRSSGVTTSSGFTQSAHSVRIPSDSRAAATKANSGDHVVATDLARVLDPLRNTLVLAKAGATVLTGLVGDLQIPEYTGSESRWEGETSKAQDGTGSFKSRKFSPKRLTTVVSISKQLLLQDSAGAEEAILRDLRNCISTKLESTILGSETIANAPNALFSTAPSVKGSVTYAQLAGIEASVESSNALVENMSYITSPKGKSILRTTERFKGSGRALTNDSADEVNGYKLLTTNAIPGKLNTDEEGLIFGNFADFLVAQWGGLEITYDPYTQSEYGMVRFVVNSYWDAGMIRDASFVLASFKA